LGWEFWPASKVTVTPPGPPSAVVWRRASSSIIGWNWVTSTWLPG
jgi:hypothetical protein